MTFKTSSLLTSALTLTLLGSGVSLAQTLTAVDIIAKLDGTQRSAKDLSFRLSGTSSLDGSAQKIDLSVQSIPASSLARVVFAAPDALADNIVVVNKTEVRNYLYLTNQITVTSTAKAAGQAGMTGLDFSQISNFSALLKNYDVRLISATGVAGSRIYTLEGEPKSAGTNDGKARVYVTEAGWRPTRLQLLDSAGKVTADLNISNYKLNSGLSAARLTTLPKDAEIIKQ
ncbi:outer membrane lipoprotein carrier protein LolA [Deinococcus sp.]|uniref:outer membrane lipoprotein carrier protein LolA n=1 Tax=Deinococcus sp. TaxID=47478 RepID=UPI003C7DBA64